MNGWWLSFILGLIGSVILGFLSQSIKRKKIYKVVWSDLDGGYTPRLKRVKFVEDKESLEVFKDLEKSEKIKILKIEELDKY